MTSSHTHLPCYGGFTIRVFVTGATGFIGSAVIQDLINAGHQVRGLARSDASAEKLQAVGARVHPGSLEDLYSLRSGAAVADGVIRLAFIHDFSKFWASGKTDQRAIEALGAELAGSDRPLIVTSGIAGLRQGKLLTEDYAPGKLLLSMMPRKSEEAALALVSKGINASVVRLPPSVHGDGDKGFVNWLINAARKKGASAYIAKGLNRWSSVHRLDAAHLFRLALEKGAAGATYHAVADEGVPIKDIATVIG
jgi:nucleoside-diphosphate-sugar epimerase